MNNKLKVIGFSILVPIYKYLYHMRQNQYPTVLDSEKTLNKLINSRVSFARFGDGEFNLVIGKGIGFQKNNPILAKKLREVLESNNDRCLIGIPDVFNGLQRFKTDAKFFWLYSVGMKWHSWKDFLLKRNIYGDSLSSRFYMDIKNISHSQKILSLWKKLWNKREVVIVEGVHTKMGVGNDLFNNVCSIKRIICPSNNAFNEYDKILTEVLKLDKKNLILIALGPTASILAFDLANKGYQAIDTGHLDLEYNWLKSGAINKEIVPGRLINEIKQSSVVELNDSCYESQIISTLIRN